VVGGLSRGLPSVAGLSVVYAPAELLQGQCQCVRARVGGEEVASSSSSGRRSGSGVGSDAGIYSMDGRRNGVG